MPYKTVPSELKPESRYTGSDAMIPKRKVPLKVFFITCAALFPVSVTAGMNGFLKAEFSNMWTATLRNKKSFKRPISKFFFPDILPYKFSSFLDKSRSALFYLSNYDRHLVTCFSFSRDHYVEGKMRGLAPSKKIAAVQQKNVDL